jgi:hypothetical protein
LRGGGMLAYDLAEAPRMAFGRIDRFVEETEQEVLDRLSRFRVRRTLGYYRQCTMVCTDDVWTFALDRMLERCRVVLVDVSDFVPGRAGIAYEIGLLLDRVPLDEVVFVCGPHTDRRAFAALVEEVWNSLAMDSPNRRHPAPELCLAITTSLDIEESNHDETQLSELRMVVDLIARAAAAHPDKPLPPPIRQAG